MTGYTVHTGSTEKFSTNWDQIFSGKKAAAKGNAAAKAAAKPAKKQAAAKKKTR